MPSGIPKNGINKGWFKKGDRHSPDTEFKKGHEPIAGFKKGNISWNKKEKIIKKCLICKNEFKVIPSRKERAKYCSKECLNKANKKYKHTIMAKSKISMAGEGRLLSEKTKAKMINASFKRWQDPEYRKKFNKENHFNWQGGKSFEPYGLEFNERLKEQIRKRDNYRCQECSKYQEDLFTKRGRKYKLTIHHIDYNKKNNNSDNLISLCNGCHIKTNFKRKDWTKYFQQKIWQN